MDEADLNARTVTLHAQLAAWLTDHHDHEPIDVRLVALSFEIARLIGVKTKSAPLWAADQLLSLVFTRLREHVTAYRADKTNGGTGT